MDRAYSSTDAMSIGYVGMTRFELVQLIKALVLQTGPALQLRRIPILFRDKGGSRTLFVSFAD